MFDRLKSNYFIFVLVFAFLGIFFSLLSTNVEYQLETIKFLDSSDKIITKEILKIPFINQLYSVLSLFFYSLSVSIFISVFITNRLEKHEKENQEKQISKLQESISENVFDSLFKTIIPPEIFTIIKKDIIRNKILRRDAQWLFDFSINTEGYISLKKTIKYTVENVCQELVNNPVKMNSFEGEDEINILEKAIVEIDNKNVIQFVGLDSNENIGVNVEKNKGITIISFDVKVPPNKSVYLTVVFKTIYKTKGVQDYYGTVYPLIKGNVIATYPEEYDFTLFEYSSSDFNLSLEEENRKIYILNGAMLPNQGFAYFLKKKK